MNATTTYLTGVRAGKHVALVFRESLANDVTLFHLSSLAYEL